MPARYIGKLSLKLILVLSTILLLNLSVYTYFTINKLEDDLTVACTQNALNLSDIVKKSTRYSMLLNRRIDVAQIINTVGTEAGVYKIRVYNKDGLIAYSSDSAEVGKVYNVKSQSCAPCHNKPHLPANLELKDMTRYFWNEKGVKVLGLINPIKNEPDCYTADCHYHTSEPKLLGILDISMSTDRIDTVIDSNVSNIIYSSIIIMLVIAVFIILFVNIIVNKPLGEISQGIKEISRGNLDYTIPLSTKDELGSIVAQFNNMSSRLSIAYNEIKDWSENLNKKVEEKNEELKKIYEQVVQIEKLASLGKLSATVAHELNNPLEGILTYSKLIAKKISKENSEGKYDQIIKFLNLISDETSRCGRIVKDLLLFSHKNEGTFIDYSIKEIIDKSLLLINHHFQINNIKLIKEFCENDTFINCDPQKVEQALISVLINGIESMPEGGTLKISLSEEKSKSIIRIEDQGRGINEKDLANIFEPFFTTKKSIKGTGLGLAVVYGIIQQHKGNISVESTSINGTVFKIELPKV